MSWFFGVSCFLVGLSLFSKNKNKNMKPLRKNSATRVTMTDIQVSRVVTPAAYFQNPPAADKLFKRQFTRFCEGLPRGASFTGMLPPLDPLHRYTFECTKQLAGFARRGGAHEYRIEKFIRAERMVLDRALVTTLARQYGGLTAKDAEGAMATISDAAAHGQCGPLIRELGQFEWFQKLEKMFPVYFRLWYIDELCRPQQSTTTTTRSSKLNKIFTNVTISTLSQEDLSSLIRIVAITPWKMCFWWLNNIPLIDDLPAAPAMAMARRFSHESQTEQDALMWAAATAYSGNPFGHARDNGDSFVSMSTFTQAILSDITRASLIKSNVVEIVRVPDVNATPSTTTTTMVRCYAGVVGDRMCEEQVAQLITDIVTKNSDKDVTTFPQAKCWPWHSEDKTLALTPEQLTAFEMAQKRRLVVIKGKPGVGKTAFVLKSIASMFPQGEVIGVAFTGMAAKKLHDIVGSGYTAHRIIDRYHRLNGDITNEEYEFAKYKVLIIEEASNISTRLIRHLLMALGGSKSLRRIIITGDPRQMPPPGGGSSLLVALANRYQNTPLAITLVQSKRITDDTGAYMSNLDSIIEYNDTDAVSPRIVYGDPMAKLATIYKPLLLRWSPNPGDSTPFAFVQRGKNAQETVGIIRMALMQCGVHPDAIDSSYYIATHTNDQSDELAVPWYQAGAVAKVVPMYRPHEFHINEYVMFLENNYGNYPPGSAFISNPVMNGTTGRIIDIYDEDVSAKKKPTNGAEPPPTKLGKTASTTTTTPPVTRIEDTAALPSYPMCVRWIHVALPLDITIALFIYDQSNIKQPYTNIYDRNNITRACPATVAKLQGQEAEVVVVYLDASELEYNTNSRREIYTACSRGKRKCIIIDNYNSSDAYSITEPTPCPSVALFRCVANNAVYAKHTIFHSRFPAFEEIDRLTRTTPTLSMSHRPYIK
jgi:hypothetical protein